MTLYYEEHGDTEGPLIVFLHGGGVSGWMWNQQLEYFNDYHCIVLDLPEQGRSRGEGMFSIRSSADKIIDLIEDKEKGKPVILIGFSLGAQITIQIVSMKHELIDCAIINSALTKPMPLGWKFLKPFVKLSHPLTKWKKFSKLQAKVLYIPENDFEKYFQETCDMEVDTLIRILEENMSFKVPPDFKLASSNMLVTVGENENKLMKKSAQNIINSNSNCHGVLVSRVGHGLPIANPELFNSLVMNWIEKHIKMKN
ncbi:alpha/beta fold hydrolase [Bacillus norwichensis]|uniref:Alpha/beta hydrolase n=1 Tax=Bacillus norwichensis TaxID=2762217 RepID=A0ABR8VJU9_9BACI|nr:alpha/beta hydrolase [Bacillus norwichensis]MBD8005054.1 alpha/beta hydrolase [Bacillus norwichensis]